MTEGPVLLDIDASGLARLTLNRPDAANSINLDLARALAEKARDLEESDTVRAVLFTGRGNRFCGGGDVKAFASEGELSEGLSEIVARLHEAIESFARLDAPIVAAVQGSAAGAGLSLVALSDLVVAAESTKFVMAYTAIGLTPDGGSTWFLPRVIGLRRAVELSLTNRALSAQEACEWGLVTKVVADAAVTQEAETLAMQLATGPTKSYGVSKRLLRDAIGASLHDQLEREEAELLSAGRRHDALEGVAAFAEKREAKFTNK